MAKYPQIAIFHVLYAELLAQFERFDESIAEYRTSIKCQPDSSAYYVQLGRILAVVYKRYEEPYSTNLFNEAVDALYKSLELEPNDIGAKIILSGLLQDVKEYEASMSIARKALDQEPENGYALHNLGVALYHLKRLEEAERILVQAEEALPQDSKVVFMLAKVLEAKGEFGKARLVFNRYKLLNPLSP